MKEIYLVIEKVEPSSQFILWLACNDKLATKERMHRFGMLAENHCVFSIHLNSLLLLK